MYGFATSHFISIIAETIQETLDEYRDDDFVNRSLLWEMIKLKVREKSLSYSKHRKKQAKQHEMELEQSIVKLEEKFDNGNLTESQTSYLEDEIDKQKLEYEKIIEYRTKGAILRSKARWYKEGEKNTKYFLSLEKRHFKQSTISHIKVSDNVFISSDKDILCACMSFYKSLYESKVTVTNILDALVFFDGENDTALKDYERNACEGKLDQKEALDALKTMESEKNSRHRWLTS